MPSKMKFDTRPLYAQVADEFVRRIVRGEWAVDRVLANEVDIARDLHVSLGTVRKAFDILDDLRIIDRVQGKGTRVLDMRAGMKVHRFIPTRDRRNNLVLGELHPKNPRIVGATPMLAALFGIGEGDEMIRFERTRIHAGRVFMVEDVHMPVVADDQLTLDQRVDMLWYDRDVTNNKRERLEASIVGDVDAETLDLKPSDLLLQTTRVLTGYTGSVLEHRVGRVNLGDDLLFVST